MPNINKNIIMQAGAAVANATNKAAGLSASTPEPGSIISAIQLVNGGRTIGPASLLHFTESVRNKLLSLLVTMEPIQDFNGYGHPWPAGGGVNKLDPTHTYTGMAYNPTVGATFNLAVASPSKITDNGDGSFTFDVAAAWDNRGWLVPVTAGNTYRISVKFSGAGVRKTDGFLDSDYKVLTKNNEASNPLNMSGTYTPSVDGYWYCCITTNANNDITIDNPSFSVGSTAPASWTPYENLCPISGRTGMNVYAGPTDSIGDTATYSMDWTSPTGTVYAGSADIVSGEIKAAPYYESYNGETLVGPWVSSMDVYDPEGTPTTGAQVVDLGGAMTEYHITGQDIITLVGDNYIWSDSGDVTITE